jgi:hypothetical protein
MGGNIGINPKFDKLITSLRTAVDNEGTLVKEVTSYNDILDAFRLKSTCLDDCVMKLAYSQTTGPP